MKIINNKVVIDLKKVQHGRQYWKDQWNNSRGYPPEKEALYIYGMKQGNPDQAAFPVVENHSKETLRQRAKRCNAESQWVVHVAFELAANHRVVFSGTKAALMWKAWNAYIFAKRDKQKSKKKKQ